MNLTITKIAKHRIQKIKLGKSKILRIDAEMQGGCGTMIKFKLMEDNPRKSDTLIKTEGLQFYVDHFTRRNLDESLVLDYHMDTGFVFESEWGPMGLECHLA